MTDRETNIDGGTDDISADVQRKVVRYFAKDDRDRHREIYDALDHQ